MTNKDFKLFKEIVSEVDDKHPIWWQGWAWLDLTDKQCEIVYNILKSRGMEQGDRVVIPSGLAINR